MFKPNEVSYCKVKFRTLLPSKSDHVAITTKFFLRPDIADSNLVNRVLVLIYFLNIRKRSKKRAVQSFMFLTRPALLPLPSPSKEELNWAEFDVAQNVLVLTDLY